MTSPILWMLPVLLLYILTTVCCESDHHWGWVGLFEIDSSMLNTMWIFDKNLHAIDDFKVVVLQSPSSDEKDLDQLETDANLLYDSGNVWQDSEFVSAGEVHMHTVSKDTWAEFISFKFSSNGYYAIFFDIQVDDFCHAEGDCFKNAMGNRVHMHWEHSIEHDHHDEHSDDTTARWGNTLQACIIVWTAVFAGVVLLGGGCRKYESIDPASVSVDYLNMFAAGALLGTAFCLVLTEASHMIATEYDESTTSGYWGAMVLVGYVSCGCFEILRHYADSLFRFCFSESGQHLATSPQSSSMGGDHAAVAPSSIEGQYELVAKGYVSDAATPIGCDGDVEDAHMKPVGEMKGKSVNSSKEVGKEVQLEIISTIFIGDFFHNFSDGIFIGAAFQTCSSTVAWTIVLSTVFHEFAQEIADFIVLTKKGQLSICQALTVNAISGLSVVIGGVVIGVQDMKESTVGMLLAFGAGNYIYLAATELYPAFHDFSEPRHKLFALLFFVFGAVAVGLVLLDHEHCEADSQHQH